MVTFLGASPPPPFFVFANFSKYGCCQTKLITKLLEFITLYKQNPLQKFIFTTYQDYKVLDLQTSEI